MQILSLCLKGFKTIKDINLQFQNKKYILVGMNLDGESTTDSNGAGKSSLINGMFWVITGKDIDNLSHSDIITYGENEMSGEILIEHFSNKMKIIRRRTQAGTHEVVVYIEKDGKTIRYDDTPTKILTIVYNFLFPNRASAKTKDLNEMLLRTVFLSGDRLDIFSSKDITATERMNIVYNIIDNNSMTKLEQIEDILKDKVKEINSKLDVIEKMIIPSQQVSLLLHELDSYNNAILNRHKTIESLQEERKEFAKERTKINAILSEISEKRKTIEDKIWVNEKDIQAYEQELKTLNIKNSVIETTKKTLRKECEEYEHKYNDFCLTQEFKDVNYDDKIIELTQKISLLENEIKEIKQLIEESASLDKAKKYNCPECNNEIIMINAKLLKNSDVEQLENIKKEAVLKKNKKENILTTYKDELIIVKKEKGIFDSFKKVEEQLRIAKEKEENYKEYLIDVSHIEQKISQKRAKIDILREELKPFDISNYLQQLNENNEIVEKFDYKIMKIKEEITEYKIKISSINLNIEQHEKNIEFYKNGKRAFNIAIRWQKILKLYKQERITQTLVDFEFYSNKIFNELCGGELKFEFENFGASNGRFKVYGKLSSDHDFRPINTFSSGECRRCGFAMSLAAREVISPNNELSLLILDECIDKIDESGRIQISQSLVDSDNQIILVTHTPDVATYFEDTIVVTKINGESVIEIR